MFCRALSVYHSVGLRGILDETYSTKKSVFCGETPLDKLNHKKRIWKAMLPSMAF